MAYVGLKELDDEEEVLLKRVAEKEFGKLKKYSRNLDFHLQIKKLFKGGKPNYEVRLRIDAPHLVAESSALDRDLKKVVHVAFSKIEKELEHRFKID